MTIKIEKIEDTKNLPRETKETLPYGGERIRNPTTVRIATDRDRHLIHLSRLQKFLIIPFAFVLSFLIWNNIEWQSLLETLSQFAATLIQPFSTMPPVIMFPIMGFLIFYTIKFVRDLTLER